MALQGKASINRQKYPKKKRLMFQDLQELPGKYSVIALSKMSKVRATQLATIRKKFRHELTIKVIKNRVAHRAFERLSSPKGLDYLGKNLDGQCALMFTNISPFKLNLIFDRNKVFLPAKGGDVATRDIIIPAGNTGISPGPVLSEFKEANVPTKIDQGSIWISRDTVIAHSGTIISTKLASLMSKLNIKPIEAGISINMAIAEGLIFNESDLKISLAEYREQLRRSTQMALLLAMEAGYPTRETIKEIVIRAQQNSIATTTEAGFLTQDTAKFVLARANSKAQIIANLSASRGYVPQ
jgi:large subunit ribosomal protein L10